MFTDSPVILAPMAGGVSTPELVAAVTNAGGFGFLAAGYLTVDALAEQWKATTALTDRPFGVNVFVPTRERGEGLEVYLVELAEEADRYEVPLGDAVFDHDDYQAKVELLIALRAPVVSFTFGLPSGADVDRLHAAGSTVIVTVTTAGEARAALRVGADVLCAQGTEAGGHRGCFDPRERDQTGLLPLLGALSEVTRPVLAAGGLMRAADVAAVRAAGAAAAMCGTAFLRCPEAATKEQHREALAAGNRPTTLTTAFTGRPARGLMNRFTGAHRFAPPAYPQIHYATVPLRAAAAAAGDQEGMALWAGEGYRLGRAEPAADVLRALTP